jgi:hypothetical protein
MPTSYTQKRRIGSILRATDEIVGFKQIGDKFHRNAGAVDRNSTAAIASALLALSVPAGIVVQPIVRLDVFLVGASIDTSVSFGDAAAGSADTTVARVATGASDSNDHRDVIVDPAFFSDTSRQIYHSQINTTSTPSVSVVQTLSWIDRRGQDA